MEIGCHAQTNAPVGSWKTAMRPWSPTLMGGAMTRPPAAATACASASASGVPMYSDQAVGASGIILGPIPATG